MTKTPDPAAARSEKLENVLDRFYLEHGAGWELVSVSRVGGTDYPSLGRDLMLVFQRWRY